MPEKNGLTSYKNFSCINTYGDFQSWAKTGKLKDNMNIDLAILRTLLKGKKGEVYGYVLSTLEPEKNDELDKVTFRQKGSAPNFQGGIITLCTCMHHMRSYKENSTEWKGVWIAGFTNRNEAWEKRNCLFYLMQVQDPYDSHKDIWDNLRKARGFKNAREYKFGDLYEPKPNIRSKVFSASSYHEPDSNHVHRRKENPNEWKNDIECKCLGRRPVRLVGDPKFSFLWSSPNISFKRGPEKRPFRIKHWNTIEKFLKSLK